MYKPATLSYEQSQQLYRTRMSRQHAYAVSACCRLLNVFCMLYCIVLTAFWLVRWCAYFFVYLCPLFNFVQVEILLFFTNNLYFLDLASTILSLTFDLQAEIQA